MVNRDNRLLVKRRAKEGFDAQPDEPIAADQVRHGGERSADERVGSEMFKPPTFRDRTARSS